MNDLAKRCANVTLLLSDVDGVMTNGGLTYHASAGESKTFHIRDGQGVRLWREAGLRFGILTARSSEVVARRAAELNADFIRQGHDDKLVQVDAIAAEIGIPRQAIAYIGDDLLDLPVLQSVGLGIAVADAVIEVRTAACYVTRVAGGQGAVREAVELILKNTARWERVLRLYGAERLPAGDSETRVPEV
jgi:YrbI family 3-deoxy-D-manno-octulosonate 8-phosphate phosphatase